MLLNLRGDTAAGSGFFQRWLAPLGGAAFAGVLVTALSAGAQGAAFPPAAAGFGSVGELGRELYGRFFYPFEVISLLLVVAMVGAVLLAKRRL
jgi:NADH-quinone oxidoreductase subunit J